MARRPLVLLDLQGHKRGYVVTGDSASVIWQDGTEQEFVPGAELDSMPSRTVPMVGSAAGDNTLRLTLSRGVQSLREARKSTPLQMATVRVFWWPEDGPLRDEHEVFRGICRDPQWDMGAGEDSTVSVTLTPPRRLDGVAFPPSGISDEGRFPEAVDSAKGHDVPVIYGTVTGLPLYAVAPDGGTDWRVIIAGHPIVSTNIEVFREGTAIVGSPFAVSTAIDGRGQAYSYIVMDEALSNDGDNFYAVEVSGWGGPNGEVIERLGDVLEHAFRTYTGGVWFDLDRPRIEAAKPILNRFRIGFFVNERQGGTLEDFLVSRIANQYPVLFGSPSGRFGWDAAVFPGVFEAQVVGRLTYGVNIGDRTGPNETSADDVLSELEMTWRLDGYQGGPAQSMRFNKDNSGDCRRALSRWGKAPVFTMDASDAPDASTVYLLMSDTAVKRTRVRERVEYAGAPAECWDVPCGSIFLITDPDLGWSDEPCLLESVRPRLDFGTDVVMLELEGR